jgi:hypothetical protein
LWHRSDQGWVGMVDFDEEQPHSLPPNSREQLLPSDDNPILTEEELEALRAAVELPFSDELASLAAGFEAEIKYANSNGWETDTIRARAEGDEDYRRMRAIIKRVKNLTESLAETDIQRAQDEAQGHFVNTEAWRRVLAIAQEIFARLQSGSTSLTIRYHQLSQTLQNDLTVLTQRANTLPDL